MLWTDILSSAEHTTAAARILASWGLSPEQFAHDDDAMVGMVDLDREQLTTSADTAGQLWIHCSTIAKLIERISDRDFLTRILHDELAQIEIWAEYTASSTDRAVVVPALQELQRRLVHTHRIASRHVSALLILVTGSGIPLRQLSVNTLDCRFGYRDILTTCRAARQIVPGRRLLTDRDAHVHGLEVAASDGPLDPVAVLLNAIEYEPYVRTLPWYGYDVEPFLLPGGGDTLGAIFARFDAHARSRIVREIEGTESSRGSSRGGPKCRHRPDGPSGE